MWTGGDVVELTPLLAFPGVVAARGKAEESKLFVSLTVDRM